MPEVPRPVSVPITDGQLWVDPKTKLEVQTGLLREYLNRQGSLSKEQYIDLVKAATRMLSTESNLLDLTGSFILFGDLHGQFYD
jgi:hypothetical protein